MQQGVDAPDGLTTLAARGVEYRMSLPDRGVDYIQRSIARTGAPYEQPMLEAMAEWLRPGDLVVDVGANVGNHTLFLAAVLGCRVLAVEPDPHLCVAIGDSVLANGLQDKVRVECAGLGQVDGLASLVPGPEANLGAQRLRVGDGGITVRTLDGVVAGEDVRAVKVDVEGMELDVLRGGQAVLSSSRPVLFVEAASVAAFDPLSQFLGERGYVYVATFNATPTHLFVPSDHPSLRGALEQQHTESARQTMDLQARLAGAERALAAARRLLGPGSGPDQGQDAGRPGAPATSSQVSGPDGFAAAGPRLLAALLREEQVLLREEQALLREEQALRRIGVVEARSEALAGEVTELEQRLAATTAALETVRRSRAYRLAGALRRATRRPRPAAAAASRPDRVSRPVTSRSSGVGSAPPAPPPPEGSGHEGDRRQRLSGLAALIRTAAQERDPHRPTVAVVSSTAVAALLEGTCNLVELTPAGWQDELVLVAPDLVLLDETGPLPGPWAGSEGTDEVRAWAASYGVPVVRWTGPAASGTGTDGVPLPPAVDPRAHTPVGARRRGRSGVVVVGAGPEAQELCARIERAGAEARLLAPVARLDPDVGRKTAVVVLHPSVGSGLAQLQVQALATGAAVVSDRRSGPFDALLADDLSGDDPAGRLARLAQDEDLLEHRRFVAVTAVMQEHTGARRLEQVLAAAGLDGAPWTSSAPPSVVALVAPGDPDAAARLVRVLDGQVGVRLAVVAVAAPDAAAVLVEGLPDVRVVADVAAVDDVVAEHLVAGVDLVAVVHEDDDHAPEHLSHLSLGRLISDGEVFGVAVRATGVQWTTTRRLPVRSSATTGRYAVHLEWGRLLRDRDDAEVISGRCVLLADPSARRPAADRRDLTDVRMPTGSPTEESSA